MVLLFEMCTGATDCNHTSTEYCTYLRSVARVTVNSTDLAHFFIFSHNPNASLG